MALVSNSPVLPNRKKSFAKSWTIVERLGIKSNGIDKTEKRIQISTKIIPTF